MPIDFNPKFNFDIFILIGGTIFLLTSMLTGKRKKLDRWEAGILFGFYILYTIYLVMSEI
jgi:cation:H+ antiporter